MSQDFAKKKSTTKPRRKPAAAQQSNAKQGGQWVGFVAGTAFGIFLSLLTWLSTIDPQDIPKPALATPTAKPAPTDSRTPSAEPRFEFYDRLSEQDIEFPKEIAEFGENHTNNISDYLLQAGSFRRTEEADRRRAQLILLGMEASISETHGDTGRWYRVQAGPFATRSKLERARATLADQNIDTLLLKRSR
ncbi:MAG: cell division protein FtsN [Halieaceae bacterium]|jgi:cell division protein FtsN